MNDRGVDPNEMNTPHDFDADASEAILAGHGADIDPRLTEALADLRVKYTSTPLTIGAELAALLTPSASPVTATTRSRRFARTRSSVLAKIGAATAAAIAATGGLAVANALPAPVQDVFSHLGLGAPAHDHQPSIAIDNTTTTITTVPQATTDTTVARVTTPTTNHGSVVSAVAHNHSNSCDHGTDVSQIASNNRSHNQPHVSASHAACDTTTTIAPSTTPTTTQHSDSPGSSKGDTQDHSHTSPDGSTPTSRPPQSSDHGPGSNSSPGN